jgi:hypothetical protein
MAFLKNMIKRLRFFLVVLKRKPDHATQEILNSLIANRLAYARQVSERDATLCQQ